jgi:hypothetical protein
MIELRPPDLENLAEKRVECPVCGGPGMVGGIVGLGDNKVGPCPNCDGKGTLVAPTGRGTVSHSSIGTQLACLRRYGYSYEDRLELIQKPYGMSMGSAYHKALELGDPVAGAALLDRPVYDEAEREKVLKDKAIIVGASTLALERWGTTAETEVEYLIRLRNPETGAYSRTYDLHGKIDGLEDMGAFDELTEYKLVGSFDNAGEKRIVLDRQVGLECYARWRYSGRPVRKVRKRWMRRPSIRQKQNETADDFCVRVIEDYAARPDFYIHEATTFRTDEDLLLLERELWDWAEQRRDAKGRDFYARNTGACGDYGGCQFIDLCAGDPDAMSLYRIKPERIYP